MLTEAKLLIPALLSSNPNSDGTFTVLAPTEDGIKRHKVTAPDTTLATLAADADAAEAKVKEKAKPRR